MRQFIPAFFLILALFAVPAMAQAEQYTCPMHPHYVADRPGTCPICGMDLVELASEQESEDDGAAMESMDNSDKGGMERTTVTIDPETIQNTGIRTEEAQMASFGTLVRSYGDVTENVRLQFDISARVEGWVEDLKVQAMGDEVKKGDLLFNLYSPALISAQQDLISAIATGYKGRIGSAAKRLVSLGMQKRAIEEVKSRRKAFQSVPYYAESDGLVSAMNVRDGTYAKPGMNLMTLQNYDTVWVDVSVAEQDIPYITKETKAMVSLPALGVKEKEAAIDYIYPTIDRATRTGRIRLVLDNADGKLKPGAYADVELETGVDRRLSIPGDAILKSKDGDFVVVAMDQGRFQPRKILAGLKYKGRTEVLDGLAEKDKVVVSGQFLIDSESALRESFRKMQRMQMPLALLDMTDDQLAMIDHLIDVAIYMQKELTAGRTPNPNMIMPAITLGDHLMPVFRGTKLQFVLEDAEMALKAAQDNVTDKEWQTSLNDLVTALKPWLLEGKPQHYKSKGLQFYMAHGLDTYWLQLGDAVENPYGEGHPMKIDWPDKVEAEAPEITEMPAGGAHANH
ncbi:MAG: efflux transporter periplasmic adaptor subunit [Alphaproteobacteria bacterium]|nr:efflux transporter periplasmic adaptor subunit [Alphaproteobacteria bacterium]